MPSWLTLDRNSLSRSRRKKDSPATPKSKSSISSASTLKSPSMRTQTSPAQEVPLRSPTISEKLRRVKNGSDRPHVLHKRSETVPTMRTITDKLSLDDDQNAKNFTVGNVGAGGLLYLKPSRAAVPNLAYAPATPPRTSDGASSAYSQRPLLRASDLSGAWTPRLDIARSAAMTGIPVPPMPVLDPQPRPRSYSFSSVHDRRRSIIHESNELELPTAGDFTPRQRRASSTAELPPRDLKDIPIPHYRLGTPRFSERGTAYLHYSIATNSTGGYPSSVLSRAEYEKLFPVPPGRAVHSFYSHLSGGGYLHASGVYSRSPISRTPDASARPSTIRVISPALFDKLEANLDDPAVVHYHPTTGRIVAATPSRLIAQITSPQFLDYELLADFFLTFRCFMTCSDVLEFLIARMRWAFMGGNDAGRIARVRTFVALRHWILNYFVDDFMVDAPFRQSFCDLVNDLANMLRQRADGGGGDINIVGELKKCWRRTCALYWHVSDALEVSPSEDIVPGGEPRPIGSESALSLPLTIRPASGRRSVFEMTQITLPERPDPWGGNAMVPHNLNGPSQRSTRTARTASIPASPTSEQSLEVLSCSVPFLRYLRPTARSREKPAPAAPPKTLVTQGKTNISQRPRHGHKRSGSFNDALRDDRTPLSSPKTDHIELKDLPSFAITGGLIRGILLQPSTAKVDNHVPVTPCPPASELTESRLAENEHYFGQAQHSTIGARKLVREVRRALSSRKGGSVSPTRSVGSAGSESRGTSRLRETTRKPQMEYQQLPGPSRLDILGMVIENTYQDAVEVMQRQRPESNLQAVQEKPLMERPSKEDINLNDVEYYSEKPLPEPPRQETPRPDDTGRIRSQRPALNSVMRGSDVTDFGRLNSHVTTGSRSIVIVDATGAPQLPMMSGGLPSWGSASTDMMPIPLFRDRHDQPPVPPIPQGLVARGSSTAGVRMRARSQDSALRTSDARMHDLLTEPSAWELIDKSSRVPSRAQSFHPRRSSSIVHSTNFQMPALPHQLRRQPGGDLKAANHVHELAPKPLRRHSLASLSVASQSYTASGVYSIDESPVGGVSLPPEARSQKQRSVSLIQALSSQPILRPSFVAEAEKLKSMPDDIGSDGGIEDALAKLEGKIPSPQLSHFPMPKSGSNRASANVPAHQDDENTEQPVAEYQEPANPQDDTAASPPEAIKDEDEDGPDEPLKPPPLLAELPNGEIKMTYYQPTMPSPGQDSGESAPLTETQGASVFQPSESGIRSESSQTDYVEPVVPHDDQEAADDEESSITPIITKETRMTQYPIPDPYPRTGASTPESFPVERRPDSMLNSASGTRYPSFRPGPWGESVHPSFLLDDNETLSDISTQLSSWYEDDTGVRSFFFDDTGEEDQKEAISLRTDQSTPTPFDHHVDGLPTRRQLRTRNVSDPKRPLKGMISNPRLLPQTSNQPFPRRQYNGPKAGNELPPTFPAHLPFVLAYESEVIAEQLTIIEKDALDEVDWKDLVSLNWSQNPPDVRNWVDFVNRDNTNGIDVIIARFNLVVKWCISEIVLTDVPSERARAITKYIHIANHCRRLRNFASMYQIILALLSVDLARLHRTWSLVSLREKQMLESMEKLCRPVRNFHKLRQEMETAMPNNGIIPFIGLYTHDLMFNALKSSRIDSPSDSNEPQINFERYQTAATIVKNLLRLIEASARYAFRPEPEALSRCLWIAALQDHEITARSRALEAL